LPKSCSLNYEIAKLKELHDTKIELYEKRMKTMERSMEERDKSHQQVILSYEARLAKHQREIQHEKHEKFNILEELNSVKERLARETATGGRSRELEDLLKEKATLQMKMEKLGAELDSYKLRLIENEVKNKRETLERLEISNARRIKTKFRRMKFIGEPKSFQEILDLMGQMESFPLKSKERLGALEEFCIYGNANEENLDKLRTLNGTRHAAKSLASTDAVLVPIFILLLVDCSKSFMLRSPAYSRLLAVVPSLSGAWRYKLPC